MTKASATLRVVTFNIRNGRAEDGPNSWRFRRAWVPGFIFGLGADVVGLQEAFADQVEEITAGLPGYARVGVGRDDGHSEGEFCPIYYRSDRFDAAEQGTFWFSETPEIPGSRMPEASLPRICTWVRLRERHGTRALRVANLHLDHASESARLHSVNMLAERVAEWKCEEPVVVMGDFNAGERSPEIATLLGDARADLCDTFRRLRSDATGVATYHGFRGGIDGEKIDYIVATSGVRVVDAAILRDTVGGAFPSDHYPVCADVAIDA